MVNRGKFITIEGVEGCGKSTQIKRIASFLKQFPFDVVLTREPGDTKIGKKLRAVLLDPDHDYMDPRCEAYLYMADRAQHLKETIIPALNRGAWVVCDRYHDSTLAYQALARGVNGLSYEGFLLPDVTVLLDLDPAEGLKRAISRNQEHSLQSEARFELEELGFHKKVRAGFLKLADMEPNRYVIIDAHGNPDEVFARIETHLREMTERLRV